MKTADACSMCIMYQVWSALYALTYLILKTPYEMHTTIIRILEVGKLRHREVK